MGDSLLIFKLIKSEGIAHHSYFIGVNGQAVVVDPRRDVDIYMRLAESEGLEITHIFETHRNEDYVIGSLELANLTGAEIFHGKKLDFAYGTPVSDKDKFIIGYIELEILETPGHTLESITIVLRDLRVSEDVQMIFPGDVIFAGETGRIDFYGLDKRSEMAGLLYDSIFDKILPLGDQAVLCPAHGAGSVCGADIRRQDFTTTGYEARTNPQLKSKSREDFINLKIKEEHYTPPYFKKMEDFNKNGAPIIGCVPHLKAIPPKKLVEMKNNGAQILDVRKPTSYAGGHIPGSLNIWKEGVATFAGWFLNYEESIVLVDDDSYGINDVRNSLIRLGFDNLYGFLANGFPSWYVTVENVDSLRLWTVKQLKEHQFDGDFFLLDVRKINDWKKGHIEGAHHLYIGEVPERLSEIPQGIPVVVYCDSGNKSTVVCSFLKENGYNDVISVLGSITAWKKAGYPVKS